MKKEEEKETGTEETNTEKKTARAYRREGKKKKTPTKRRRNDEGKDKTIAHRPSFYAILSIQPLSPRSTLLALIPFREIHPLHPVPLSTNRVVSVRSSVIILSIFFLSIGPSR